VCRSIQILRNGGAIGDDAAIAAAARQFVRKVSGFSRPTARHEAVFESAVQEIVTTTRRLLDEVAKNLPPPAPDQAWTPRRSRRVAPGPAA